MEHLGPIKSTHGLDQHGLFNVGRVHWNLPPAALVERTLALGRGRLSSDGALVVETGQYTGRTPAARYIVEGGESHDDIDWGAVNRGISRAHAERLHARLTSWMQSKDLYVQEAYAGADPRYRLPVRVVSTSPQHSLFVHHMFLRPTREERAAFVPEFTVLHAPFLEANPATDGTATGAFVVLDLEKKRVLIGGTRYAGEIKKSIFSVMNYLLPAQGVLCMHASVNVGRADDPAIFFGLSGTGKTTLSADPERALIGDDEHGWSDQGVFNFEGGCYAKMIKLSAEAEPEIWAAVHRYGAMLENVVMDPHSRELDLDDGSLTQNTRGSYPLHFLPSAAEESVAGHPRNVVMLTADAYGVLPPISKLTPAQAMYHFISGYTAKVAGTERGVTEPQATFSACFGAPFMPRHPGVYAKMLGEKMEQHGATAWLVNTGWTGGPYGTGHRMPIKHTRAMLHAALDGKLDDIETKQDPIFGLHVPVSVPGVPDEVLFPRGTWEDQGAYDKTARRLADLFHANFTQFEDGVSEEIKGAGPLYR